MKLQFVFALALSLSVSTISYGQCYGPENQGNNIYLNTSCPEFVSSLGAEQYRIYLSGSDVRITSSDGLQFLVNPFNASQAKRSGTIADASSGSYSSDVILYNISSHTGQFGAGVSGLIGIRNPDGFLGWIEIGQCGTRLCTPDVYQFRVHNRCFCSDEFDDLSLGNPIPTGFYPASMKISSSGVVGAMSTVKFSAKDSINLLTKFEVKTGGTFETNTEGCVLNP